MPFLTSETAGCVCDSQVTEGRPCHSLHFPAQCAHFTYMNRHVEVVGLELISHFSKALETVLPHCLLEAKCLPGLTALL